MENQVDDALMLKRGDRPALSAHVSAQDDATRFLVSMLWATPENRPWLVEPRQVEFYLYFWDEESARALGRNLVGRGYLIDIEQRKPPEWRLRVSVRINVRAEAIISIERLLRSLADYAGGEYDGWGITHPKP